MRLFGRKKDYAKKFKECVESNNMGEAARIILEWSEKDPNDANLRLADIGSSAMVGLGSGLGNALSLSSVRQSDATNKELYDWYIKFAEVNVQRQLQKEGETSGVNISFNAVKK